jgi:6-phosphogluconolactonase (cycloisomerase 2 family)
VKGLNGFTGTVALDCAIVEAHPGMACNLSNANPAATSTGTSVTATITSSAATTPTGSYTVQVTGTTSAGAHPALPFTVNVKGIINAVSPLVQSVQSAGSQANFTVTTTALNGFTGSATLSCVAPLPTGLSCGFGPSNTATLSITPSAIGTNTNLRVTVANGTPVGQYHLSANAASGTTLNAPAPFQLNVGVPVITGINSGSGAWGQTVTISGSAFDPILAKNTVLFNGVQAAVTGGSTTSLNVVVPQTSTTGNVTVATDVDISNPFPFTVQNLSPRVATVIPNALTVGAPATTISLAGSDFVPGGQVLLDGTAISTNFVSPTQITATVSQAQAASAHVYSLTVFNPAPGGGTSSASNFVITAVDPAKSTIAAVPSSNVLANNTASSTVTVTVKNSANAGVSGQTVQLFASGSGNTVSPDVITNGSGVATFTIKSTKAETKTLSATINLAPGSTMLLDGQATVGFVADASTISASLSTAQATPATGVLADGVSQSAISVQLLDAFGNAVSGQTVSLSSSGSGNVLSSPAITDASGTVVGSIASTVAETKTVTVTVNPGAGQVVLSTHPTVGFVTPVARFAFVANKNDNTVSGFTINVATGQLRHNGYAVTGTAPAAVATDSSGKFLFIANSGSANVSAFTIASDGHLDPAAGSPFPAGDTPRALVVDRGGKFLYVANANDGTITTFDIDPVTGSLSSSSNIAAGVTPSALFADPRGKYLYVANSGSGNITGYSIDPLTGVLSTIGSSPFAAGTGPVAIAGDRSARFLYAANNGGASVASYQLDLATGALINTGTAATGAGPSSVVVHPSGLFAYTANTAGSVSMFSVDQSDGHLTPLATPTVNAGSSPSSIGLDASGQYAFVGNSGTNDISIFTVNGGTGQLIPVTGTSATVRARVAPSAIAMTSGASAVTYAPKYAYVGQDSGNVNAYSVNSSTGSLTSISGGLSGLGDARAVANDLRGKFLLVGIFSGANVRSYSINSAGALTSVNLAATGSAPFAVAFDPSGRFAYVANKGSANVSLLSVNPTTGALARIANETPGGTAGRDITVDPTGRFVYTADDVNSKVTSFKIGSNGALTQTGQQTVSGAFGVKVDPSGRFMYAIGNTSPSVAIYSINSVDGSLSPTGNGPNALGSPHSVEISPDGKFAFAANTSTNTVTGFTVNVATGALSNAVPYGSGSNSFQVRTDPSGQFLYVPNKLSGNVSVYQINPLTGGLTTAPDQGGLNGPHQVALTPVIQ